MRRSRRPASIAWSRSKRDRSPRGPTSVRARARACALRRRARLAGPDEVGGAGAGVRRARASSASRSGTCARSGARPFYSETDATPATTRAHVIQKNLRAARASSAIDATDGRVSADAATSPALERVRQGVAATAPFALINPGAAWPNKRWPAGAVRRGGGVPARRYAACRRSCCGGRARKLLAQRSSTRRTGRRGWRRRRAIADLVALVARGVADGVGRYRAAAHRGGRRDAGRGLFGPTDPQRNGPWSRGRRRCRGSSACACHYERRCRQARRGASAASRVAEVTAAVQQRLATLRATGERGRDG